MSFRFQEAACENRQKTSVTARRRNVARMSWLSLSRADAISVTRRLMRRWPSSVERRIVEDVGQPLGGRKRIARAAALRPDDDGDILLVAAIEIGRPIGGLHVAEERVDRRRRARRLVVETQGAAHQPEQFGIDGGAIEDGAAQGQDGARHARTSSTRQTRSRRDPSGSDVARMAKRRRPSVKRMAPVTPSR